MDIMWLFYGYYMVFYGYYVDIIWILCGYYMDILWILYGKVWLWDQIRDLKGCASSGLARAGLQTRFFLHRFWVWRWWPRCLAKLVWNQHFTQIYMDLYGFIWIYDISIITRIFRPTYITGEGHCLQSGVLGGSCRGWCLREPWPSGPSCHPNTTLRYHQA